MTLVQRSLRSRIGKAPRAPAADTPETRPAADAATAEPPRVAAEDKGFRAEQFIGRYFMRMPPAVRVGVYLLIVLVYVHNSMQESILMGQLWVRGADGSESQAANYIIQTWTPYATNAEGRWALPAGKRLPLGTIEAEILTANKVSLGTTELCLPLPIIGPMLGSPHYRIVFDEKTRTLSTRATPRCASVGTLMSTVFAAEQIPSLAKASNALYVTIRDITLRNTGHGDSTAEVYFRVYVNGQELRPRGFPSRDQEGTWLLLIDGKTAALNNLTFTVAAPSPTLTIEVWDRDRSIKSFLGSQDDRLAEFAYDLRRAEIGTRVLNAPGGTTLTVELHR